MAILFTLPSRLWHTFSYSGGVNLKKMIKMIKDDRSDRNKTDNIMKLIKAQLQMKKYFQRRTFMRRRFHLRNYCSRITLLLFVIKFLYTLNTLGQLLFLINFLRLQRSDLDVRVFDTIFQDGVDGFESSRFPRVTMCDFMIRELGSNQHWYTVQCNLPINIFNEVIFFSIVIWLVVLTSMNIMSIIVWVILLTESSRKRSISQWLRFYQTLETNTTIENSKRMGNGFIDYIGLDGFIILRVIGQNTDTLFMIEMIGYLHQHFVKDDQDTEKSIV